MRFGDAAGPRRFFTLFMDFGVDILAFLDKTTFNPDTLRYKIDANGPNPALARANPGSRRLWGLKDETHVAEGLHLDRTGRGDRHSRHSRRGRHPAVHRFVRCSENCGRPIRLWSAAIHRGPSLCVKQGGLAYRHNNRSHGRGARDLECGFHLRGCDIPE